MKAFLQSRKRRSRAGFNLVEATLSMGLMSFGFLALIPLLALGLKTTRQARDDRTNAQIAQTLVEEAKQGTLAAGTTYLDEEGAPTTSTQAAFQAQATFVAMTGSLTRLSLQVTPVGAPNRARTYAAIFPPPN